MFKKFIHLCIVYGVIFTAFVLTALFFINERQILDSVLQLNTQLLVLQTGLDLLFGLVVYYIHNQIYSAFLLRLPFHEWFGLGCVNSLGNYIFPLKSGIVIKTLYLKKKFNFAITQSLSIILFSHFLFAEITFLLSFFFFLIIKFLFPALSQHYDILFVFSFVGWVGGALLLLGLQRFKDSLLMRPSTNPVTTKISAILQAMIFLGRNKRLMLILIALNILVFIVQMLRLQCAFATIHVHVNVYQLAVINLVYCLNSLIVFLPGNLGFQEAAISLATVITGLNVESGILVAGIIRAVSVMTTFVLGLFYFHSLKIATYLRFRL